MRQNFELSFPGGSTKRNVACLPPQDTSGETLLTLETVRLVMTTIEGFRTAIGILGLHYIKNGGAGLVTIGDSIRDSDTSRMRFALITQPFAQVDPQELNLGKVDAVIQATISGEAEALITTRAQLLGDLAGMGMHHEEIRKGLVFSPTGSVKTWKLKAQ